MADIQMRFGKDMLVLSTSFNHSFAQLGFDLATEEAYVDLCEPETVEQAYQMEKMIGTPCFCTATECITNARLAHEKFEGHGKDIAAFAWESVHAFNPEHALAVIGPSGLPLDESSAASLKASRAQYQTAAKELVEYPFDALFFSGFTSAYDAQCALMGARAVYDGPVFLSYALTDAGELPTHTHTLAEAVALADEYGADVIGIASGATYEHLAPAIETLRENTTKPLLAELVVRELIERAYDPDLDNPYYSPDRMIDTALKLRQRIPAGWSLPSPVSMWSHKEGFGMAKLEKSPDFGVLQDFVDSLFADAEEQTRLDIVVQAESLDLNPDLLEIVSLLPPGTYDRNKLCDQFNSSLSSHGWGYYYGAVH